MTAADLKILIQEGEGTTLEFKEALSASFAREMVSLANTIGGKILLGVRDDGTAVGVKDSNPLRARLQDIARNCDPPVKVLIEAVGKVLVVTVRESGGKPVQCREGFFWRQGATTQKLTRDEIRDFFRSEGAIRPLPLPDLGTKSVRRNALVADLLHRIDFIEKAGTGIKRIRDEAREGGYPEPVWKANGFVTTVFRPNPEVRAAAEAQAAGETGQVTPQVPDKYPTSTRQVLAALAKADEPLPRAALQEASGLRNREHFVNEHLTPLVAAGLLQLTIPDKPRSSKQRYRITALGLAVLKRAKEER